MLLKGAVKLILPLIILTASVEMRHFKSSSKKKGNGNTGGDVAELDQYAHIVSLLWVYYKDLAEILICGTTIVNKFWAVTAASCLGGEVASLTFEIVFRGNTSFINGSNSRDHHIEFFQVHDQYINAPVLSNQYDIAVVKVKEPFDDVYERPISIAPKNYKYRIGLKVRTLGFSSADSARWETSNTLRVADTKLRNVEQCRRVYSWFNFNNGGILKVFVTNINICADPTTTNHCEAGRGGAVVKNNQLIGIISYNMDCLSQRFPDVYTKVSVLYDWIKSFTESDGF